MMAPRPVHVRLVDMVELVFDVTAALHDAPATQAAAEPDMDMLMANMYVEE